MTIVRHLVKLLLFTESSPFENLFAISSRQIAQKREFLERKFLKFSERKTVKLAVKFPQFKPPKLNEFTEFVRILSMQIWKSLSSFTLLLVVYNPSRPNLESRTLKVEPTDLHSSAVVFDLLGILILNSRSEIQTLNSNLSAVLNGHM